MRSTGEMPPVGEPVKTERSRKCWSCGRFQRWDPICGWIEHVTWDSYLSAWELDCDSRGRWP